MKIRVTMVNVLDVPSLLESELRGAIELKDNDYRDELIGDIENHYGWEESTITSVEEVKE